MHEILTKTMMPPADGLCGLLQLLEAGATAHADLWGCGRQTMLERYRCAWMIARGWVRIHHPIPRAPLTLRTWIRPVKHGLSRREFDLLEGDTLIAEAVQAWILVDLQTRRIRTMDDIPIAFEGPWEAYRLRWLWWRKYGVGRASRTALFRSDGRFCRCSYHRNCF